MKVTLVTLQRLLSLTVTGCVIESGGGYGDHDEHGWGDRDHHESRDDQGQRGNWGH